MVMVVNINYQMQKKYNNMQNIIILFCLLSFIIITSKFLGSFRRLTHNKNLYKGNEPKTFQEAMCELGTLDKSKYNCIRREAGKGEWIPSWREPDKPYIQEEGHAKVISGSCHAEGDYSVALGFSEDKNNTI